MTQFHGHHQQKSTGRGNRRRDLITTPKVCPRGRKWTNTATFNFQNGDKDSGSSTSRCKPNAAHAHGPTAEMPRPPAARVVRACAEARSGRSIFARPDQCGAARGGG